MNGQAQTQTNTSATNDAAAAAAAAASGAKTTGTSLLTEPDKKTEGAAAGAGEQKKTADTGGDKAKAEAEQKKAAEDFELKLPDGVQADKAFLDGFKALAKEHGLKGEQAQKYVDFYVQAQKQAVEASDKAWAEQNEAWKKAVKDDKDLGGKNYDATLAHAKRFVAKFASPGLTKLLEESGLGNHPESVRLFAAAGKALAEDSVGGSGSPTNKRGPDDPASLYPNTKF